MHEDSTPGGGSTCRRCYDAIIKANRRRTAETVDREAANLRSRLRKYRLTADEYQRLLQEQEGGCAICGQPPVPGKKLVIDHDHGNGLVRMLLCSNCNSGLGMFADDPKRLVLAARYLLTHRQEWTPTDSDALSLVQEAEPEL